MIGQPAACDSWCKAALLNSSGKASQEYVSSLTVNLFRCQFVRLSCRRTGPLWLGIFYAMHVSVVN